MSDYFGEISMVYGCKRTANVQSTKYTTLAKLSYERYKEVLIEFPDLTIELKKHIFKYNDKQKAFMIKRMREIEFFKDIDEDSTHDIMYSFIGESYAKDEYLQTIGDINSSLYFLQRGVIEIETRCDNEVDFTIEKLFRGSIVNYRTFFMEQGAMVSYRFGTKSVVFSLTKERIEELTKKH